MRLVLLAIIASVILAPAQAQDREPTEPEMRVAVEQWFNDLHMQYREMAQACTGPVTERRLPPDICAKICASPTTCAAPFEIRSFRKESCRPPTAAGQVECSFTIDMVTANPAMREAGAAGRGWFGVVNGQWRFSKVPPQ